MFENYGLAPPKRALRKSDGARSFHWGVRNGSGVGLVALGADLRSGNGSGRSGNGSGCDLDGLGIDMGDLGMVFLSFLVFVFFLVFLSFLFFLGMDLSDLAMGMRVDLGVLGMDAGELAVDLAVHLDAL